MCEDGTGLNPNFYPKLHSHPVIGVIVTARAKPDGSAYQCLTQSYANWLQGSGARVVPIFPGRSTDHYYDLFSCLNGLFIPGGSGLPLDLQRPLTGITQLFLNWAMESLNKNGDYFPIWGACLGLQALLTLNVFQRYDEMTAASIMHPTFTPNSSPMKGVFGCLESTLIGPTAEGSNMLGHLPKNLYQAAATLPIHPYVHCYGVPSSEFKRLGVDGFYKLLGVNRDAQGMEYVTFVEAKKYPIYATMVHYEKCVYQWQDTYFTVDKRLEAIQLSQALGNFFVQECCKNNHKFPSKEAELSVLIENYTPKFVAREGKPYDMLYLF